MIRCFTLLSFLFISISAFTQNSTVRKLVNEWEKANNLQDLQKLKSLYSSQLNFYAYENTRQSCLAAKSTLFKRHPDYKIKISILNIESYTDSKVKCDFMKEEYWGGITQKPMAGYLVFQKSGDSYTIIIESDQKMDAQRGYQLMLGKRVEAQEASVLLWVAIASAILVVAGVGYLLSQNANLIMNKFAKVPVKY